jgi:glycosyltransferase involved in cell wall biosynthesis
MEMKILLIAYYYPPINTGGTVRPLKMAKYLTHSGHRVTVLTHSYEKTDLQNPHVLRIKDISHNKNRRGLRKVQWLFLRLVTETLNKLGIYCSIYSWWKKKTLKNGRKIIETVKPDVILTTYPPVETLQIGLELSREYGIPLISDFRDGLLFEPIETKRMNQYRCIRKKYAEIEQAAARESAFITAIAHPISDYFKRKYGITAAHIISNGFDPEDFGDLAKEEMFAAGHFNIVFTGRFALSDKYNRVDYFFEALRGLVAEHRDMAAKIRLHLVGEYRKEEMNRLRDLIDAKIIVLHGFVEREKSLAYQKAADLLLIITPPDRRSATSIKIFEYLYARKPILALTHQTVLEDIIEETGTGWIVHPHKPAEIGRLLHRIISDPAFYNSLRPDRRKVEQYSVARQVAKLSKLIEEL